MTLGIKFKKTLLNYPETEFILKRCHFYDE